MGKVLRRNPRSLSSSLHPREGGGGNEDKDGELRLVDNGSGSVRRAHEDDPPQGLKSSAGPKLQKVTQPIQTYVYNIVTPKALPGVELKTLSL